MGKKKKILIIYTGGTIGMVRSEEDQSYRPFDFHLIKSQIPELEKIYAELEVISFDPLLDSSNIGPEVWIKLAKTIGENYTDFDGFVILHGSDTMAYTGSALSFLIEGLDKPVILTGSQLPMGEIRTDAKENLLASIEIASHPGTPIKEVCIYFEYRLHRANRTKKVYADRFSAFRSPSFMPIAEAGITLKFYRPTPEDAYTNIHFRIQEELENNISLIKFFPGMPIATLHAALHIPETKGIILESFGSGNLPTDETLIKEIRKSIDSGKVLMNITQCTGGTVDMQRYATGKLLQEAGVLNGADLTCEAALTKMMYLMKRYNDIEKVKYYLVRNIRGEMNSERAYTK